MREKRRLRNVPFNKWCVDLRYLLVQQLTIQESFFEIVLLVMFLLRLINTATSNMESVLTEPNIYINFQTVLIFVS